PLESENYVKDLKQKVLVIYTEQDQIVQAKRTIALIEKFETKPKILIIKNRTHNDLFTSEQYWPAINDFIFNG
ncbi:hypothetical protein MJH12_09980, partial [bacterium]|nr:hypothetical protein [bacterium]